MALQYPMIPAQQDRANAPLPAPEPRLTALTWPGCAGPWTAVSPITPGPCTTPSGAGLKPGPRPGAPCLSRLPRPRRRLPGPPGRGTPLVGGYRPATQGSLGRHPQGRWPPDPTDNEAVRQIMKGIARAHGKVQRQARPLTAEALAAVKATAKSRRPLEDGKRQESAERPHGGAGWTWPCWPPCGTGCYVGQRPRHLTWGDVEFRDDRAALITLRRSKTDQEAEGVVLYIGTEASQALLDIRPAPELLDPGASIFGMTTRHIGNRVRAAAKAAGLGEGYTGHSGRGGHGPGPGEKRRGTAGADDRRPVEIVPNAGEIY